MPVIYQKHIFREDLLRNPRVLYLFGDNDERRGLGGQAREMRGEENAVGIRTKVRPGLFPLDFWTDDTFMENVKKINNDMNRPLRHVRDGGIVVVPADGIGTGLSKLDQFAPKTFRHVESLLWHLEHC